VIEDDILIHKTYFQYIRAVKSCAAENEFSAICAVSRSNNGDPDRITKGSDYSPWAPLINKRFWELYIMHFANGGYYQNRKRTILSINRKYEKYGYERYKMAEVNEFDNHDGLINRLVDVARIEKNLYVVVPEVDRQIHIGFYGTNTPGKDLPGAGYEERLKILRSIVTENRLNEYTESTVSTFDGFSDALDRWSGSVSFG
jgi:hypothetical protein